MTGPHRSIDIAGSGAPETSQNGWERGYRGSATGEAQWPIGPRTAGQGIVGPRSDAAGQSVDVTGGWARQAAGSGWVSGTMAHLSKRRRAARRGKAIANQTGMPGTGDPRPAVRRGRIGRYLSGLS